MYARALKTFQSKYGLIRRGTIFQPEPNYAKQLQRNKLVEEVSDEVARKSIEPLHVPGPGEGRQDKSIPGAPQKKTPGKDQPGKAPAKPGSDSAVTPDAGKVPGSSASDQDPASSAKTLTTSNAGGRRAVTTPKRKRSARQVIQPVKPSDE